MRQRLISAAVLVPVVVIVFLAGQPWLSIAIALLSAMAAYETARLVRLSGLRAYTYLAVPAPILTVLTFEIVLRPGGLELGWLLIAPGLALWLMIAALPALREPDPRDGFLGWIGTVFAGLYPSLLAFAAGLALIGAGVPAAAPAVHFFDPGRNWLLSLVVTVWAYDSFAYLAGRFYGRGRFMYHVSPAKTWSGVIVGTVAAAAAGTGLAWVLFAIEPWWGAALGLLIAVAAQTGDLAESMLKRAASVKDSGSLIPGHGGFLDRVDSFVFAAPALYASLVVAQLLHGGGLA